VKPLTPDQLAEGIIAVITNAEELLGEAQTLLNCGKAARAYALAWEACEEIAKAPMLSTTMYKLFFQASIDWRTLHKRLRSHPAKALLSEEIRLRVEASKIRESYLRNVAPGQVLDVKVLFPVTAAKPGSAQSRADLRAKAINCDFDGQTFRRPSEVIHTDDAHTAIAAGVEQLAHAKKLFQPSSVESVRKTIEEGVRRCEEFAAWGAAVNERGGKLPPLFQQMATFKSALLNRPQSGKTR